VEKNARSTVERTFQKTSWSDEGLTYAFHLLGQIGLPEICPSDDENEFQDVDFQ
jgi:hypothetical protein